MKSFYYLKFVVLYYYVAIFKESISKYVMLKKYPQKIKPLQYLINIGYNV
jgi:hypothetical protein